jgi:hypothetical protein
MELLMPSDAVYFMWAPALWIEWRMIKELNSA